MIAQSTTKNAVILALFALFTAGLIVLTATLTQPKIERDKAKHLKRSLLEVMPNPALDDNLLQHGVALAPHPLLGNKKPTIGYVAKVDGEPAGIIMQVVAPEGYGGSIRLLLGLDAAGTITGVRVVPPHFETPGLGDAIEIKKSDWITRFDGKSLTNLSQKQWTVKKDGGEFDAFTGATITPRAVVDAVYKGLLYFDQHRSELLYSDSQVPTQGEAP